MMFDIKAAEKQAKEEVAEEAKKGAVVKIKAKLKAIALSEEVTANLKREYEVLLREVAAGGSD